MPSIQNPSDFISALKDIHKQQKRTEAFSILKCALLGCIVPWPAYASVMLCHPLIHFIKNLPRNGWPGLSDFLLCFSIYAASSALLIVIGGRLLRLRPIRKYFFPCLGITLLLLPILIGIHIQFSLR